MDVDIVDTTLRDGEQKAGIALGVRDKVRIAQILDSLGVFQIEAGIPAMGGDEKESITRMAALGLNSKISAWNRMHVDDIRKSMECGADMIHISVPSSDIQIKDKLGKDREWVADRMKRCIAFTKDRDYEVTIGFEDASRSDFDFLLHLCSIAFAEGVRRIRYADTVGILYPGRILKEIRSIRSQTKIEIEMHAHNDFGMAVANSVAAAKGGAKYVDCTFGGIGERAGNCNYIQFIRAWSGISDRCYDVDIKALEDAEKEIMGIICDPKDRLT